MKVKITGETIAAFDKVWLTPRGTRGKKLITVTGLTHVDADALHGGSITVFGVLAGTRTPVIVTGIFPAEPVEMEL
jgi:hypothetical protein